MSHSCTAPVVAVAMCVCFCVCSICPYYLHKHIYPCMRRHLIVFTSAWVVLIEAYQPPSQCTVDTQCLARIHPWYIVRCVAIDGSWQCPARTNATWHCVERRQRLQNFLCIAISGVGRVPIKPAAPVTDRRSLSQRHRKGRHHLLYRTILKPGNNRICCSIHIDVQANSVYDGDTNHWSSWRGPPSISLLVRLKN